MSENTPNTNNIRNDEIDLLDLFRRIGNTFARWGAAIGKGILISIVFCIRKWIPLTISVILALALSFALRQTMRSFYTADLVLRANIGPTDEVISHVNRLHNFCMDPSKEVLAKSIGLSLAQADNILDIKAYWIIDKGHDEIPDYVDYEETFQNLDTLIARMQDRLDIRVRILQPQELSNVRDGIIRFINSEPLFQQRNNLRIRQTNEMLSRLEIDIKDLDSLQRFKYFEETRNILPKVGGQMVFLQEQKTQLLYTDIHKLYSMKQSMEQNRDLYKDIVTVISDFTIPVERDNGGRYYAKTFVPIFFLLTLFILILLANKKKIHEVYKKY